MKQQEIAILRKSNIMAFSHSKCLHKHKLDVLSTELDLRNQMPAFPAPPSSTVKPHLRPAIIGFSASNTSFAGSQKSWHTSYMEGATIPTLYAGMKQIADKLNASISFQNCTEYGGF